MKRLSIVIASLVVSAAAVFAHDGNDHVRGVVTQLSPQSITVQTTDKKTTTLKVTEKTTFQLAGKAARLAGSEGRRSSGPARSEGNNRGTAHPDRSAGNGKCGSRKARHHVPELAETDEDRR